MSQLFLLGAQIIAIPLVGRNLDRDALDDAKPIAIQADHLLGVVGEESNLPDAQIDENLRADAVMAQVGAKAQTLIRLYGIQSLSGYRCSS